MDSVDEQEFVRSGGESSGILKDSHSDFPCGLLIVGTSQNVDGLAIGPTQQIINGLRDKGFLLLRDVHVRVADFVLQDFRHPQASTFTERRLFSTSLPNRQDFRGLLTAIDCKTVLNTLEMNRIREHFPTESRYVDRIRIPEIRLADIRHRRLATLFKQIIPKKLKVYLKHRLLNRRLNRGQGRQHIPLGQPMSNQDLARSHPLCLRNTLNLKTLRTRLRHDAKA